METIKVDGEVKGFKADSMEDLEGWNFHYGFFHKRLEDGTPIFNCFMSKGMHSRSVIVPKSVYVKLLEEE